MTIDYLIRDGKRQYNINRKTALISTLSSTEIGKYEYLIDEEILPSNRQEIIDQAKFAYSLLGKAFEKQIKTIEDQRKKQVKKALKLKEQIKSIEGIFLKDYESVEIKNEINKIKEYKKKLNRDNMIYYSSKEPFNFKTFKTIRSLGENIYGGKITVDEADEEQSDLIEDILNFNNKARPKNRDDKKSKKMFLILQKIFIMAEN